MKKKLIYLGLTGCILFALCTKLQAQIDSLQTHRYVTRATMYGIGFTNVFDTYLSPQEYKGIDFRISRETIRMTKLFDGNVSVQNFFQADIGYTHNRADNNNRSFATAGKALSVYRISGNSVDGLGLCVSNRSSRTDKV